MAKKIGLIERLSVVAGSLNMLGCLIRSLDGKIELTASDLEDCIVGCAEDVMCAISELRDMDLKEDDDD